MARVFISHSSRDAEAADRIKTWLQAQGFEAPFLDFDKHAGIAPGADWEKTLYREVEQCEAVIVIQTPNWLDSKWCFAEFTQARALGKAIFPVIETPTGDTLISPDIQALDLQLDRAGGLDRLARQLTQIALDAQGGFAWDAKRAPYPGLLAFQEEDAALYFGRDDDIRRLIERLNARRTQGGSRLLALLGASGSGKSSLLRAGVIPRLKRAGRQWITVVPMRPQLRPVDELARVLALALGKWTDWRVLQAGLLGPDLDPLLSDLAADLRMKAGANEAQILLPIDQAEELFGAAEPEQAARFLDILSRMMAGDLPFIAVMALRSDYLGLLQSAAHLTARFEEFSLGPLPLGRVAQIIQGPARVAGLRVDEALVHQAVRDAETEDALPLLAFALRELYDQCGGDGQLSLSEYLGMGDAQAGLTPLENAVRRAADGVLADARPDDAALQALREAFVPAMVRINDQGEYVRRPAEWDGLPAKAQPLLERLATARLLIIRQDGHARIVEVAHEALLRKWPLLRGWLDEAREFLIGKQQLAQDLQDWAQAGAAEQAGALLSGLKLNRARVWLAERPQQLSAAERAYVQASIAQAEADAEAKLRQRRNVTRASMAAAAVLAVVAGIAGVNWYRAGISEAAALAETQKTKDALTALTASQTALSSTNTALTQSSGQLKTTEAARTNELIGYVWADLAGTQREAERLVNKAAELNSKAKDLRLAPNALVKPAGVQADGFNCQTGLEVGFRYLYCSVRSVISFQKMAAVAAVPVFSPGGPHGREVRLDDQNKFGHYNPDFLDWLAAHIVPKASGGSALYQDMTARVYKAYIGPAARALYRTHEALFISPEAFQAQASRYALVKQKQIGERVGNAGSRGGIGSFSTEPTTFASVQADYQRRLQLPEAQREKDAFGSRSNGTFLEDRFLWLSDYLQAVFPHDDSNDDWYMASAAAGFWVRRSIDGTEGRVFALVKTLLQAFDKNALSKP